MEKPFLAPEPQEKRQQLGLAHPSTPTWNMTKGEHPNSSKPPINSHFPVLKVKEPTLDI